MDCGQLQISLGLTWEWQQKLKSLLQCDLGQAWSPPPGSWLAAWLLSWQGQTVTRDIRHDARCVTHHHLLGVPEN